MRIYNKNYKNIYLPWKKKSFIRPKYPKNDIATVYQHESSIVSSERKFACPRRRRKKERNQRKCWKRKPAVANCRTPAFLVFLWIGILGEKILFTTKYQERRDVRIEVNVQVGGHRCSGMRRQVSAVEALSLSLSLSLSFSLANTEVFFFSFSRLFKMIYGTWVKTRPIGMRTRVRTRPVWDENKCETLVTCSHLKRVWSWVPYPHKKSTWDKIKV